MDQQKQKSLELLYHNWAGTPCDSFTPLPLSGSDRQYVRMRGPAGSALGVWNNDKLENAAFLGFTRHFHQAGVRVPEVLSEDTTSDTYLVQDLGDTTLLNIVIPERDRGEFSENLKELYRKSLRSLAYMQVIASQGLDYSLCHSRAKFDKQSMLWDLSYFKYYFLRLAKVPFDESRLEDDFHTLADYLLSTDTEYFLFRDFQARNIMIYGGEPWFIDYQGGRQGALQYDLASLLYQSQAAIPQEIRLELLEGYLDELERFILVNRKEFREYFFGYVLIRVLQTMGAYGFRGLIERREHFLDSIPYSLLNLDWILENVKLPIQIPELWQAMKALTLSPELARYGKKVSGPGQLTVTVNSFSYLKSPIPTDPEHGGGFVFDCRALANPGRYAQYKALTGLDSAVIQFLRTESRIEDFLQSVHELTDPAVETYIERGFTDLMINFGCTGGQHRSVYCAEEVARRLSRKYGVKVRLRHIEQRIEREI